MKTFSPYHNVMNRIHAFLLLILAAPALGQMVYHAADLNKDGRLDDKELAVQVIHEGDPELAEADSIDVDGLLSDAEVVAAVKAFESNLRSKMEGQRQKKADTLAAITTATHGTPVPYERAFDVTGIPLNGGKVFEAPLWGLQIRRNASDIDPRYPPRTVQSEVSAAQALSSVAPAEFSFASNGLNSNEVWIARGVIARPFALTEPSQGDWSWAFTPYLTFERVSNTVNTVNDIDKLSFTTALTGVTPGFGPMGYSLVDVGFDYTTNFDFRGSIYSGHLNWTPIFNRPVWWANDKAMPVPFGLGSLYRFRQYLHLEGGSARGMPALSAQSDFLRGGAALGADLIIPLGGRDLTFSADYRFYADLLSRDDDHYNVRFAANLPIDPSQHLTLQIAYERGLITLFQQAVDLMTIGFGLRF